MKNWCTKSITYLLLLSLVFPILLTGCGMENHVSKKIKDEYPLESVNGSGNQTSYVYRAAGKTVPVVTEELSQERPPEQKSKASDERMFLVYPEEIIHIQKDTKNPKDTLIEIDSKEYVKKNYSPGFLEGFLLSTLVNKLFDYGKSSGGEYRGFATKDKYKPRNLYRNPTSDEKKKHPPLTVDRTSSIIRRSKTANSSPNLSNESRSMKSSDGYIKMKSRPRTSSGRGKISRRRR